MVVAIRARRGLVAQDCHEERHPSDGQLNPKIPNSSHAPPFVLVPPGLQTFLSMLLLADSAPTAPDWNTTHLHVLQLAVYLIGAGLWRPLRCNVDLRKRADIAGALREHERALGHVRVAQKAANRGHQRHAGLRGVEAVLKNL